MMGASCSSQRQHNHHHRHDGRGDATSSHPRHRHRRHVVGVGRFRTFPFCGSSEDGSSEDEQPIKCSTKRAARHSIDAEVPNQAISTFYPPDDNYELHPTDSTKRCPKSLTDLCIDTICRSLPNLDGELPPGLPKEVVDRILQSLTSHAALNSTTLRALRKCELGKLSLANCRGVSDEWLLSLGSSGSSCSGSCSSGSSSTSGCGSSSGSGKKQRCLPASPTSNCPTSVGLFNQNFSSGPNLPSLGDAHPAQWPVPSNPGIGASMKNCENYADALNLAAHQIYTGGHNTDDTMEGADDSYESCSTSSFVSASSHPHSPFLYPMRCAPSALSSTIWLQRSPQADGAVNTSEFLSIYNLPDDDNDESLKHDSCSDSIAAAAGGGGGTVSTLTLLDLRGSQRLTDRGLLQLSYTPLRTLEVALLDNCHGITGRGLIAFAKSHRLHTLSMSNCRRLTDEAVVNVSHLGPSLVALNLGGCRCLTGRSLEALSGMVELRRLDLSQCELITDDALVNLHDLKLLEELSLGWCRSITDVGLGILAEQPNRSQALRTLRLARCSITDAGLEHLKKLENVEELDVNGCDRISSKALGEILGTLVKLTSLDVSYCPRILSSSWQGKVNALKSLELCYSGVRDSHLSNLRSLPILEELNLDSCVVGDSGIAHLVDNNVMPNLTTLDLADTNISDVAMAKIAQFKEMRHLSLFYCNISNSGLRYLASMKNLEILNLDSRDIGDEGLKYLRGLNLKSLDLFSSRVTDIGCAYLSKIKTLTSLELCGGGIGDWGCAHLASLHNLTCLNLSQNEGITNRGAAALAALTNLKALNLSNTRVNSDALKFFGGLLKLQSMALYGCSDIADSPKLSSLHNELPSLRCLRLNSASNEDGVIEHFNDSDADDEEDGDDDAEGEAEVQERVLNVNAAYGIEENDGDDPDEDVDDAGADEDEDDMDHDEDLDDDPFNVFYDHVDGDDSVESSDEDSMGDFHDAYNEVESVDSSRSAMDSMNGEI